MPTFQEIINLIETAAPLRWQEPWDNSGVQVGWGLAERECTGALVTLDVTEDIVKEAIKTGTNLILSHHPLLFAGLKTLGDSTAAERIVTAAILNNLVIYAAHTNIDSAPQGVSHRLAVLLGLEHIRTLIPSSAEPTVGLGCIGELPEPMPTEKFLDRIVQITGIPCLRHSSMATPTLRRVAVSGGSGAEFIEAARAAGADLYLSADFKYHDFQRGEGTITLVDSGHYETEVQVLDLFRELLSEKMPNFAVRRGRTESNPIHYHRK